MISAIKCSLTSNLCLKQRIALIRWITTLYYNQLPLPSVTNDQRVVGDNNLTYTELFGALKGMPPCNDSLTKEFCETFWDGLKDSFINLIKLAYGKKLLSISQRQAFIKLIVKKIVTKQWKIGDQFPYLIEILK